MPTSHTYFDNAPPWYRERALILSRICKLIHKRVNAGVPRAAAVRSVPIERYAGRRYKSKPHSLIRLSRTTISRAYTKWAKYPFPEAFIPSYLANRCSGIPPALRLEIMRRVPQYNSLREVFRSLIADWESGHAIPGIGCLRFGQIKPFPFGERNFYAQLPVRFKKAAMSYHSASYRVQRFIQRQEENLNKMKGNKQCENNTAMASGM